MPVKTAQVLSKIVLPDLLLSAENGWTFQAAHDMSELAKKLEAEYLNVQRNGVEVTVKLDDNLFIHLKRTARNVEVCVEWTGKNLRHDGDKIEQFLALIRHKYGYVYAGELVNTEVQ